MKCTIPEISWHNREPVLSVDIHCVSNEFYKLATAGGDSHVLIWQMTLEQNGAVKQEVISDLTRHQKAVNIVRWSPSGQYLASADDDANIIVWQLKTDNIPLLEGETGDKEIWVVYKVMRGHKEDIYDLCWSQSNLQLFSGSIDNTAILWNISKGKMDHILSDHKGFVQGVAWDPKNQILASISTDRICRVFDVSGKHVKARILKGKLPVGSNHFLYEKEIKYFYDDTFKSFFRRLQFSPDGSLLVVPSGHMEGEDCKRVLNATLIFTLDNMNEPAALLPHGRQCSTVVRFCPILFELRQNAPESLVNLPYRMIFAVGTDHDVILYDTQQRLPFARFQEIHYTRITDLTWSIDGLLLVASSTDGFCALITFEPEELGIPYVKEDSEDEENTLDVSVTEDVVVEKDENIDINNSTIDTEVKELELEKKPSFIEKWVRNPSKKVKQNPTSERIAKGKNDVDGSTCLNEEKNTTIKIDPIKKSPKRITPISLSKASPKRITPVAVKDNPVIGEIDLTLDSPVKTEDKPHTPKRIIPIPVIETNRKVDTTKRIIPVSETKTVKETIDSIKNSPKRRITPIPVNNTSSNVKLSDKEKLSTDKTENSPKRIKLVPAKERSASGKKESPKRIKPITLKDKSSSVKTITSFLLKGTDNKEKMTVSKGPTEGKDLPVTPQRTDEKSLLKNSIDLTCDD